MSQFFWMDRGKAGFNASFMGGTAPASLNFTRSSSGTYFDNTGTLQTAATDVPRFDYNPLTLQLQGLLLEPLATNNIRNNTLQGVAAGSPGTLPTNWGITVPTGLTRTIGTTTINGMACLRVGYTGTATSTVGVQAVFEGLIAGAAGDNVTVSSYFQMTKITGMPAGNVLFEAWAYDAGSTLISTGSAPITGRVDGQTIGTNLVRLFTPRTMPATTAFSRLVMRTAASITNGTVCDFEFILGMPQQEAGVLPTSVIPTTTIAVARASDNANFNTSALGFNTSQGTLVYESAWVNAPNGTIAVPNDPAIATVDDGTLNNAIDYYFNTGGGTQAVRMIDATVVQSFHQSTVVAAGVSNKLAVGYQLNNTNVGANGNISTNDTSCTVPTGLTKMYLGRRAGGAGLPIWFRKVRYFNTRLPDASLQSLTT